MKAKNENQDDELKARLGKDGVAALIAAIESGVGDYPPAMKEINKGFTAKVVDFTFNHEQSGYQLPTGGTMLFGEIIFAENKSASIPVGQLKKRLPEGRISPIGLTFIKTDDKYAWSVS
jgi:hypothetical protein